MARDGEIGARHVRVTPGAYATGEPTAGEPRSLSSLEAGTSRAPAERTRDSQRRPGGGPGRRYSGSTGCPAPSREEDTTTPAARSRVARGPGAATEPGTATSGRLSGFVRRPSRPGPTSFRLDRRDCGRERAADTGFRPTKAGRSPRTILHHGRRRSRTTSTHAPPRGSSPVCAHARRLPGCARPGQPFPPAGGSSEPETDARRSYPADVFGVNSAGHGVRGRSDPTAGACLALSRAPVVATALSRCFFLPCSYRTMRF